MPHPPIDRDETDAGPDNAFAAKLAAALLLALAGLLCLAGVVSCIDSAMTPAAAPLAPATSASHPGLL